MPLADEAPDGAFELDLAFALEGHQALSDRLDLIADDPLGALLRHVRATVPFYRDLGGDLGNGLADFPIVDRDLIRDQRPRFLSTTHGGDVERLWARTNGTLAPWLPVGFDLAAFYELYYFFFARVVASSAGLREALVPGEVGIHYVSDVAEDPRLTSYIPALGGVLLRRMPFGRGADEDRATVEELQRADLQILYGKVPTLLSLAALDRSIGDGDRRIRPRALLMSGAPLYPRDRAHLERWFRCPIINAYAATEGGLIAIECESGGMHILDDRIHVEILLPDGRLADAGSGELVITNFMNWAQPFVRYRLDDRGTLAPVCRCGWEGPTLVAFAGRDVPSYEVRGARVDSATLAPILDREDVKQFEVSQPEPEHLLIRWIPVEGADATVIEDMLQRELAAVIGSAFELRRVEWITIPGGKGLRFVRKPRFAPIYESNSSSATTGK